jgi:hypothetical protein
MQIAKVDDRFRQHNREAISGKKYQPNTKLRRK